MKRLQCEVCGSTDMIKQDGIFVCQSCGMKYSLEAVRKMMTEADIEESVPVEKEQIIDVQELMTLARQAKSADDINNALKYYSLIHDQEPTNWEAWFYCYFYQLFVDRNAPTQFVNEIDDILNAMWSQVNEKDQKKTISEIIYNLNKTLTLCVTGEDVKSLDFEFVLFLLLSNVIVSIKGKQSNFTRMLIPLSLNALKVAEIFTQISVTRDGYIVKIGIEHLLSKRYQKQKRWNDVEKMIITIVDLLKSNCVSPQGLGAVYFYPLGDTPGLIYISNPPVTSCELTWFGSAIILKMIRNRLRFLNENCSPLDDNMTEEEIRDIVEIYNEEYEELVNKAKRLKPDFSYPNYYEQKEPKTPTNTSNKDEFSFEETINEIKYGLSRFDAGYLSCLLFSYAIALFMGSVAGESYKSLSERDDDWIYIPFVLAIVCGFLFRYIFNREFGGHKAITFIAVSVAVIVAILVTLVLPGLINAMGYWVLFIYAICL